MTTSPKPTLINPATGRRWTLKDGVTAVMPEAASVAGAVFDARDLYYAVRPRLQKLVGIEGEVAFHYYSQHLLPDYQRDVDVTGEILAGLRREKRGELILPHSGEVIPLGTREVDEFDIPEFEFDKLLFIEKTGLSDRLAPARLGQRNDMAIIFSKGYSVVACRNLLTRIAAEDIDIYAVHDADHDGYGILRTLREANERMPNHSVNVIDLGLTVKQAISMRLETESLIRKKDLPQKLLSNGLTAKELEWFTGTPILGPKGENWYRATRCELNSLLDQRLGQWIQKRLDQEGAVPKLVPPADVLADRVEWERDNSLSVMIWNYLRERIDVDEVIEQIKERHPEVEGDVGEDRVRDWFAATDDNVLEPWGNGVEALVDEDIEAVAEIGDTIEELVIEQLEQSE